MSRNKRNKKNDVKKRDAVEIVICVDRECPCDDDLRPNMICAETANPDIFVWLSKELAADIIENADKRSDIPEIVSKSGEFVVDSNGDVMEGLTLEDILVTIKFREGIALTPITDAEGMEAIVAPDDEQPEPEDEPEEDYVPEGAELIPPGCIIEPLTVDAYLEEHEFNVSMSDKAGVLIRDQVAAQDNVVVQDVLIDDCYRLKDLPRPNEIIFDIGAHIGVAHLALHKEFPDAMIISVEPHQGNAELVEMNIQQGTSDLKSSVAKHFSVAGAISYSDEPLHLHHTVYEGCSTTGGSFTGSERQHAGYDNESEYHGHDVIPADRVYTIGDLMQRFDVDRIDLLKLDCEGAEVDILENIDTSIVGIIVGEWHDKDRVFSIIKERFDGWDFDILRDGQLGLFRIANPNWWNRK